ncbi:hypothetical protein LTR97_003895 [Elasticomyces elasticus]|uniref:Uncharacterized protein n=1 Tax=Elasticomyces elasticus TaxID=574655 RepID=A0AAN7ZUV5_9PEZI|nr:hypothetical protein LTR97_003895 [Elasticomyces elasticus]
MNTPSSLLRFELAKQQVKPMSITNEVSLEAMLAENEHLKSVPAEKERYIDNPRVQLEMMSDSPEIEKFNAAMVASRLELTVERVKRDVEDAASCLMLEDDSDDNLSDGHFLRTRRQATSTSDLLSHDEDEGETNDDEDDDVCDGERAETNAGVGGEQQAESAASVELPHPPVENSEEVAAEQYMVLPELTAEPTMGDSTMDKCEAELEKLAKELENAAGDEDAVEEVLGRIRSSTLRSTSTARVVDRYLSSAGSIVDELQNLVGDLVGNGLHVEIRIFRAWQTMDHSAADVEDAVQEYQASYHEYMEDEVEDKSDLFIKAVIEIFLKRLEAELRT